MSRSSRRLRPLALAVLFAPIVVSAPAVLAQGAAPATTPTPPATTPTPPAPTARSAAVPDAAPAAAPAALREVVVTANPLGSGLFEMVQPADLLAGPRLDVRRASSLGETLSGELGISSTGFGPNASRPVIRGLDGDRIRLLRNGAGALDASSVSFDHATAIEPLVAERIEIVRGPAALLYGGSAIGGVVNAIDNRIPVEPIEGVGGRAELRHGGAERERAGVAVVEGGDGRFAWHADAWRRETDDLRIPGFARSARQRQVDATVDPETPQPYGRVPNTASSSKGGAMGLSRTWGDGHAGLSFGTLRSEYGTPAEEDVGIRLRQDTVDLSAEARGLAGFVKTLRLRANHTDYRHDEFEREDGAVGATFRNRGHELRLEALHADLGPFKGAFGLQHGRSKFAALGDEAYLPATTSDSTAVFLYEELERERWKLSLGARAERARVRSAGDAADAEDPRFGAADARSFTARSLSAGGLYAFTRSLSLSANAAYTERAPTHYELFSNGPHAATGTWEIGDSALSRERSTSVDLNLRHRSGAHLVSLAVWQTRFRNYLQLEGTGRLRGEDGSVEDASTPGLTGTGAEASLPEYLYRQVPATFRGVELLVRRRLMEAAGILDLELKADRVSAHDRNTGEPLPRIAPVRLGAALIYREGPLLLRADLTRVSAQRRISGEELPTDGYTLLGAYANWRIREGSVAWDLFLRANNLLDEEARNHTSLLKDIAPMGGRSLTVGMRVVY